jgi:hypothetical protein
LRAVREHADEHGKEHDRRGIVEQALAFEQAGEPRRRPELAKDRHDRRRIGRRHDRTEE